MLYMVEMDLLDRSLLDAWHAWYESHIGKLLTVDGYHGAQRFEALSACESPFLAVHDVDDAAVFDSAAYRNVGGPKGTGIWRERMTHWHRNLFDGCPRMPALETGAVLALIEPGVILNAAFATDVTWLDSVGLDCSIARRGMAVIEADRDTAGLRDQAGIVLYKPISPKFL